MITVQLRPPVAGEAVTQTWEILIWVGSNPVIGPPPTKRDSGDTTFDATMKLAAWLDEYEWAWAVQANGDDPKRMGEPALMDITPTADDVMSGCWACGCPLTMTPHEIHERYRAMERERTARRARAQGEASS